MPQGSALHDNIARISRHTLADQVYADVKELILSGDIPPGEKVTLRGLAAALGTSPMPVRDAIVRLVADKALDMLPNRTVQVSWPSREKFEEITLIRCSLEGLAAELAAERRGEEHLREIERHAREFDLIVAREQADGPAAIRANRNFHFAVYDAACSPALREMIEALWLQLGPVLACSITDALDSGTKWWNAGGSEDGPGLHRSHDRLRTAVASQDKDAARCAVRTDIEEASVKIIQSGRLARGSIGKT